MRNKIYRMVHLYEGNLLSVVYKWFMITVITMSLIPLAFKETNNIFIAIDYVCFFIYVVDYILRWVSADYKFNKYHWSSFVRYPFRIISIIDLISIFALLLPLMGIAIAEIFKVFRIIRIFRYSKGIRTIIGILNKSQKALASVGTLAVGYIVVSALVVFNVEPQTFDTFFDAIYWATVSLTTVGYGDIYPVSIIGRVVAMLSSFFGIAIVALPAGVITAEYMKSINKEN